MRKVVFIIFVTLFSLQSRAQVNLNLGLMAYYPFSGNANDVSPNNNNPDFNNATLTADRFGIANSAYHFNGSNNYMRIPNSPSLNTGNQISVCAWVRVTGFYQGPCHGNSMVMKGDADYLTGNYMLRFDDGNYTNFQNCVNPVPDIIHQNFYGVNLPMPGGYTPYIQNGQWYSVIYTSDGTTSKLFVNCVLKVSLPAGSFTFSNAYDLYFGKMNHPSFPYWLNGDLDEVRIYNRAINQQEVDVLGGCATNSIAGVINTYTPVLSLNPCNNKITVEDGTTFNTGDTVLLIQMKGAVIDSANTVLFGTITDYKNAGNYEFNYVKSKTGNVIELLNTITRQYDLPGGKVQLIRVPYYQNAYVTSTLTCLAWDGDKGGVLVLNAQDTIDLYANIDVSGKGFRGGNDPVSNPGSFFCNEPNYYYPVNPDLASEKGEGIAIISAAKSFGRGDLANGGGGGNSHNSGGGGGSNAAPGGFGGYNFEGSPCTNVPFDNRGIGGRALTYSNAANKIFMGGGGGAGHSNNPEAFQATGGNGSGIVIIMADKLKANANKIIANGSNAVTCGNTGSGCHEGMGGGGAGGATLLKINNYMDPAVVEIKGGNGADMIASGFLKVGPGGGGGGGKTWLSNPSLPAVVTVTVSGGPNGVCTAYANDPWGATQGQLGSTLFNLIIPVDNTPFQPNIDSVRIKDSATGCASFDFKGFGYTNTNPINSWEWFFGDGGTANTQNTSHTYASSGTFTVKLIVTDINGCKDSITKNVSTTSISTEFIYSYVPCLQQTTVFLNGPGSGNWDFGDGTFLIGSGNTLHTYGSPGIYNIKYSIITPGCSDSTIKLFDASIIPDNIIFTPDTTICLGTTKQLLAQPSGNFCWSPTTYLNNPLISNPVTSTPGSIIYFYKAETLGNNLITNGNFSAGNTGFTSDYIYQANNTNTTAAYGINTNAQSWNAGASACMDHTSGTGNMFLANGATTPGSKAWKTTVAVTPNTNYQFSFWIQSISPGNLSNSPLIYVYVNNKQLPSGINAPVTNCQWVQLKFNWTSGNISSADISLEDSNLSAIANDFALDDIFFGPVYLKRDSVKITVDTASVVTNPNTTICEGATLQLNTTGGTIYSWSPATGLSNPNIPNPVASPPVTTQYIVTGTNVNGCTAKDTVVITVNPGPAITTSNDTTICQAGSAQLFASGGSAYSWAPAATLNNPSIPNPVATPGSNTTYYVTVTGANTCTKMDSVKVDVRTASTFSINPPVNVCKNSSVQLNASGGDLYNWTPAGSLNNPAIANPMATPSATTIYFVQITDTLCHNIGNLSTTVTALPLPVITATRSNDIDCITLQSQLLATGANLYSWSPAGSLNNPNSANPLATPAVTTQYIVAGTDLSGCTNTGTVLVKVSPTSTGGYLMPTAFTPDGDGKNDCYGIKYWGTILELQFGIYNRWGERIFYSTNPAACWDGTINGVKQDPAVFIYMIKAKTTCQPEVFRKGTFVLIR